MGKADIITYPELCSRIERHKPDQPQIRAVIKWDEDEIVFMTRQALTLCTEACLRLVPKHRMITNQKSDFSLKIDISIHNWASEKICSVRYTQYQYVLFWKSRK